MKDQIIFKFPENSFYYAEDFCVGENNYEAYKLIQQWPNWDFKAINIYGPNKSGKSYLTKIFSDKTDSKIFKAKDVGKNNLDTVLNQKILIIEDIELFSDEVLFQTVLNDFISKNKFTYLTSKVPAGKIPFKLKDLISRLNSTAAVVVLLVLGGICILLSPILAVLSGIILGVGVLIIIIWIIRGILNIFK